MNKNIESYFSVRKSEDNLLNLFWFGFVLYTASYTISMTQQVNYIFCQIFQILGLVIAIPSALSLMKFKIENKYLQVIFTLYCLWLTVTVLRGFRTDYESVKIMLFDAWFGLLPYFVPLLLLFPQKPLYYKRLFTVILILGLIYILYDVLFIKDLLNSDKKNLRSQAIVEYFSRTLAVPSLFILLTFKYQSKKIRYFATFVITLLILFALVRARRSLLATTVLALVFVYILYLSQSNQKLSVVLGSFIVGIFLLLIGVEFFNSNKDGLFKSIIERGLEDTRTGVEKCFYKDMQLKDWVMGKGINGEYFCPGIDKEDITGYRDVIETDYLQTILKGGLISLILFLLIAIPAMIKGLFYSKNMFAKAAGIWILYVLLNMYPASINTFTMQYLLVWFAIGICYSNVLLTMPENEITAYFKKY